MTIRTKFIIIFLLLSLIPLSIIGLFAYKNGKDTIRKNLGASFHQIAHETINKVDNILHLVYHDINTWAGLELMQEVITGDMDGKISSFLSGLSSKYESFATINVFNIKGEIVASSNHKFIGMDFYGEDYFALIGDGDPYVKDVNYDEVVNEWVASFIFPIIADFNKDQIIGCICAKWKASELFNITQYSKETYGGNYKHRTYGSIMLINKDGMVISAPKDKQDRLFRTNLINDGLESANRASQKLEGYLVEPIDNNESIIGYDYSAGYHDFSGLGWSILVIEDTKIAFAPIVNLRAIIFGFGAIVAVIITVISIFISRKMTEPVLKISKIAKKVAQGDFEHKVDIETKDEIGSLIKNFNNMISDLKKQKKQLVDKEYVDNIIKSMGNCLIVINAEGIMKTINQPTSVLLKYAEGELINKKINMVFDDLKVYDLIHKGGIHNEETYFISKDGNKIPVIFSSSVMYSRNETVQGVVCVAHDLSRQKKLEAKLEEQHQKLIFSNKEINIKNDELATLITKLKNSQAMLIHAEKISALGTMVAGVAHELNNPMMGVINFIQYSIENTDSDNKIYPVLTDAEHGIRLCIGIVDNLLAFSRSDKEDKKGYERADCVEIIDRVLTLLSYHTKKDNISINKCYSENCPDVWIKVNNIQQVFINIIDNAIDALIDCKTKEIFVEIASDDLYLIVIIKDTGTGIDPHSIQNIFDPFFTTKPVGKGTGLGLSISHSIIEEQSGELVCESELNKGTKFIIKLPRYDKVVD